MNTPRNTSIRNAPSWMPNPKPVINSAISAIAGAAVALAAVAAWDTYDNSSLESPSFASTVQVGGGSATGRTGHVDSDPEGASVSGLTAPARPSTVQVGGSSLTGRTGHVDSDPEGASASVLPAAALPSTVQVGGSSPTGRTGHVDSDAGVLYGSDVSVAAREPLYPASRDGVRGHVFSQ